MNDREREEELAGLIEGDITDPEQLSKQITYHREMIRYHLAAARKLTKLQGLLP